MEQKDISKLIEKGFLATPDLEISSNKIDAFIQHLESLEQKPVFISNEMYNTFISQQTTQQPQHIESKLIPEIKPQQVVSEIVPEAKKSVFEPKIFIREKIETKIKIKKNHEQQNKKIDINDWVAYYFDRYNRLRDLLQNREELRNAVSIGRVDKMDGRQKVVVIGMVREVHKTFTGTYIMEIEDPTGTVKVMMRNPDILKKAEEVVPDEVLGVVGTKSKDIIYCESLVFPEIPEKPIKKAEDEVYAAFLSDLHVGSNMFLPKEFTQFINWMSGKVGNDKQKEVASKIKYVFIAGDLVDGIGIYPSQEEELVINDIYKQYTECARYLSQLPDDVQIVAVPGNHDAVRLAEPQPTFYKDVSEPLFSLPNMTLTSNPSMVNMHNIGKFPGYDVLMYHGYSLDYYASNVPSLRKTGYNRADLLQEFLLRKRHLAPAHGSTVVKPAAHDFMMIDKIPDIFATGHIHYTHVGRHKSVLNLCCGCFQDKTSFQEKVGHDPQPGRIPVVNLQTNQAKIMRFK